MNGIATPRRSAAGVVALLALMLGAVAVQQEDQTALDGIRRGWVEAYNAGDAAAAAAFYAEDAVLYDADGLAYEGRDAIEAHIAEETASREGTAAIEPLETRLLGDTAVEIGRWSLDVDGEAVQEGHYMAMSERIEGRWLISRHIVNVVLPREEPAAPIGAN